MNKTFENLLKSKEYDIKIDTYKWKTVKYRNDYKMLMDKFPIHNDYYEGVLKGIELMEENFLRLFDPKAF